MKLSVSLALIGVFFILGSGLSHAQGVRGGSDPVTTKAVSSLTIANLSSHGVKTYSIAFVARFEGATSREKIKCHVVLKGDDTGLLHRVLSVGPVGESECTLWSYGESMFVSTSGELVMSVVKVGGRFQLVLGVEFYTMPQGGGLVERVTRRYHVDPGVQLKKLVGHRLVDVRTVLFEDLVESGVEPVLNFELVF